MVMMLLTKYLIIHSKTIEKLIEDGYRDALIQMDIQAVKDEFLNLENKFVKLDSKGEKDKKK